MFQLSAICTIWKSQFSDQVLPHSVQIIKLVPKVSVKQLGNIK